MELVGLDGSKRYEDDVNEVCISLDVDGDW